jgi:hypothetical protein
MPDYNMHDGYEQRDDMMGDDMPDGETATEQHPSELLKSFIGIANTAPMLDKDQINKIGMEVTRGYDIDKASRTMAG